jgi:hypothetical protein
MKKLLALTAFALAIVALSQLVPDVGATRDTPVPRRLAALEAKVKTLQGSVTSLKKRTTALEVFGGCIISVPAPPITRYSGYLYSPDNGTTVGLVTALDITASGVTPGFYVAGVNPTCAPAFGTASAARRAPSSKSARRAASELRHLRRR